MGVSENIPAPKPEDYLMFKPVRSDDGGEATRHNIRVTEELEKIKKEKK